MGINIIDEKIVGEISFFEEKLAGEIPVAREDLIVLINSWGRTNYMYIHVIGYAEIEQCEPKECYDLSKLDVSRIKNMDDVFMYSLFEGDISQWNTSNVTSMDSMFTNTKKFNQDISNWNLEKIRLCEDMFDNANAFLDKYNDGEELPYHTDHIIEWIINNREKMNLISIKDMHGKEIDGFFHAIRFYSQNRNR